MSALPSAVAYSQGHPSLPPNARSTEVVVRASNGSSFGENATIQFDFNNSGFIDPQSIYVRYRYAFTNLVGAEMKGVPALTPFARLNCYSGSQQLESISQYNQVATMLVALTHSVSDKYSLASSYGYYNSTSVPSLDQLDGRVLVVNETGTFSAPLPCILSNCEKYIPAFAMPQLRVELVVSTLADMFKTNVVVAPTAFAITQIELVYTQIDLGADVEAMVRSTGLAHIKTQSFSNTSSLLGAGALGQVSLVYNTRLASIKSAFLFMANSRAGSNLEFDSVDITKSNGAYFLTIAGKSYPQVPYSTAINKNGIFMALRGACGTIFSRDNNCSINAMEWNVVDNVDTTLATPGKFIVGVDLEVVGSDYIMSGTSSANSAITANIQLGTATSDAHNVHLILNYDGLLEIDFMQGTASLKC